MGLQELALPLFFLSLFVYKRFDKLYIEKCVYRGLLNGTHNKEQLYRTYEKNSNMARPFNHLSLRLIYRPIDLQIDLGMLRSI